MHSRIAPSAAFQRWYCPASTTMQERYPQEETTDTREGTASHDAFYAKLTKGSLPAVGDVAENGVIYDQEMIDGAALFADDMLEIGKREGILPGSPFFLVEQKVAAPNIIHELSQGTPDGVIICLEKRKIYVFDYKYGHRRVEAFENAQCVEYTAGVFEMLKLYGLDYQQMQIDVEIRIVQPREYSSDGPIRKWITNSKELTPYFMIAKGGANSALSENPKFLTGKHCRDCTARHSCGAAARNAHHYAEYAGERLHEEMSIVNLAAELKLMRRAEEAIQHRRTGLEARIEALLRKGAQVPGWMLKPKQGRLNWKVPYDQAVLIAKMAGHDITKKQLITPTQAMKLGISEEVIKQIAERPNKGHSLVMDDLINAKTTFQEGN